MRSSAGASLYTALSGPNCAYRGMYGVVRRATLRRRHRLQARYVAVKVGGLGLVRWLAYRMRFVGIEE